MSRKAPRNLICALVHAGPQQVREDAAAPRAVRARRDLGRAIGQVEGRAVATPEVGVGARAEEGVDRGGVAVLRRRVEGRPPAASGLVRVGAVDDEELD